MLKVHETGTFPNYHNDKQHMFSQFQEGVFALTIDQGLTLDSHSSTCMYETKHMNIVLEILDCVKQKTTPVGRAQTAAVGDPMVVGLLFFLSS